MEKTGMLPLLFLFHFIDDTGVHVLALVIEAKQFESSHGSAIAA